MGRAPDPLTPPDVVPLSALHKPNLGNRFDSPLGAYKTLYFSTTLSGCYGETLARFRPDPALRAVVGNEWRDAGLMNIGAIPADWRQRRIAVHVRFPGTHEFAHGVRFLDVEALGTREALLGELGSVLAFYGHQDLDVPTVRGRDRRITRWIAQWAHDATDDEGRPRFAGIRYLSRLNSDWECWAVFDHVPMEELSRRPILPTDDALRSVAESYGLTLH